MAKMVATQPMPASQRMLGSDKKVSLLKGLELTGNEESPPLEADGDDEDDELSNSALRSLEGDRWIGFVVLDGSLGGGEGFEAVEAGVAADVELDKFGNDG